MQSNANYFSYNNNYNKAINNCFGYYKIKAITLIIIPWAVIITLVFIR